MMHLAHKHEKNHSWTNGAKRATHLGDQIMKLSKTIIMITTGLLAAVLSVPVAAEKGGNKGGGKGGSGGGGGGSGFDTPEQVFLTITFIDSFTDINGDSVPAGVRSDGYGPYFDLDLDASTENVDAHLDASAGGNYGNLYLRTSHSASRSLTLDITGCVADCDSQPFEVESFRNAALKIAATESISGGFCGMGIGQAHQITAPMQITYFDPDIESPGFVHFEPGIKGGRSPCRGDNGSAEVSVVRNGDKSWTVTGDAACVTTPDSNEPGGIVFMPFEFTAVAERSCQ
jgi:hypothetical protein